MKFLKVTRFKVFELVSLFFLAAGCGLGGGILMLIEVHFGLVNVQFWIYSSTLLAGLAFFCFWLSQAYGGAAKRVQESVQFTD